MEAIITLLIAVLFTMWGVLMPKPRSSTPAAVTLICIVLLFVVYVLKWQYPEFIPDKYLIGVLIALVVIPVIFTQYVLHEEKLHVALGKLDTDNRRILENIIVTLQNIYLNEKKMVVTLSASISEDKAVETYSEILKALGIRMPSYLPRSDDKVTLRTAIKMVLYAIWDIVVIVIIIGLARLFPYFIREMRFLRAAAVPDMLGIGLNSIEGTDKGLNRALKKRLWGATKTIRTEKSVNVIQKCLKYSHAINNLYLMELLASPKITTSSIPSSKLQLYATLTRGDPDHLISQRFAEVARVISNELAEKDDEL